MVHSKDTFMMHSKVLSLPQARFRLIGEALKGITSLSQSNPSKGKLKHFSKATQNRQKKSITARVLYNCTF